MNVEIAKQKFLDVLNDLENDTLLLQSKIKKAKNDLLNAVTEEDIKRFPRENNLEDGLKYIVLVD